MFGGNDLRCGFFATVVVFLTGMALAGSLHQIGWMSVSAESFTEPLNRTYWRISKMEMVCQVVFQCGFEQRESIADAKKEARRLLLLSAGSSSTRTLLETYRIAYFAEEGDPETVSGWVIFTRTHDEELGFRGMFGFFPENAENYIEIVFRESRSDLFVWV